MNLTTAVNRLHHLEESISEQFEQLATEVRLSKGGLLLTEGKLSTEIYYVKEGLVRAYYYEDEKEVTSWLASEGDFVCSLPSYLLGRPSHETIQLLEPSTMLVIQKNDLERLCAIYDSVESLKCDILQLYLLRYDNRIRLLRVPKAEDRLDLFVKHTPQLYNRVPLRFIASFLGIEPATLSRIRSGYKKS